MHGPLHAGQDGALHHPAPPEDGAIRQDPRLGLHFLRLCFSLLGPLNCLLYLAVRLVAVPWLPTTQYVVWRNVM